MSAMCLVIKKEPVEADSTSKDECETSPKQDVTNLPEFVNIKMEMNVETPSVSIKTEPDIVTSSSPPEYSRPQELTCTKVSLNDHRSWKRSNDLLEVSSWQPTTLREERNLLDQRVKREGNIDVESEPDEFQHNVNNKAHSGHIKKLNATPNNNKDAEPTWISTADGKYLCTRCDKSYSNKANFHRHYLIHTINTVTCSYCPKTFKSTAQLERHTRTHTAAFDCDECGKSFKSSSNLHQHKRSHMTNKPFKCPLCSKTFSVRANLNKHVGKSRCKVDKGPLICNVCHKEFKTTFLLKSHLRRHNNEKPYSCDVCEMDFKYKSTIIRHIQIHNGDKPFSCEVCHKTFTHLSLLKPHMRIHTGEKPFKCPNCPKVFAHKHNMERHTLRHAREKKTVCEICNKKFPKESRLIYHMRTHVNTKHFKCFICPKTFSHRQNILRHYTRKHPGATYKGTDTDAKIATMIWEDVKNKKILLDQVSKDGNEADVNTKNIKDADVKTHERRQHTALSPDKLVTGPRNGDVADKKEIVHESKEILPDLDRPTVKAATPKKKNLTNIVAALTKKVEDVRTLNGSNNLVLIKNEISDESDDEVLAKKIKSERSNENVTFSNGKVDVNNEISVSNEKLTHFNQIKKEVLSDAEEIVPDRNKNEMLKCINIKKEKETLKNNEFILK